MRSARNTRISPAPRSRPTTYQRPELRREPPRLDPARPAPVLELHDRAAARRVEERCQRVDERQLGDRHPAGALEPTQLHQRAGPLAAAAAEPDRGDRDVERLELALAQVEVGQVVLLRVHAVARLVVGSLAHRDPHGAQARLVPFEGLAGRLGDGGIPERRIADDLVARQPGPRLEQGGQQVQQSFAAVRGVVHQVRRGYRGARSAASTPPQAAAAASNSTGSSAAGRPIELMRRSWATSRLTMSTGATSTSS